MMSKDSSKSAGKPEPKKPLDKKTAAKTAKAVALPMAPLMINMTTADADAVFTIVGVASVTPKTKKPS